MASFKTLNPVRFLGRFLGGLGLLISSALLGAIPAAAQQRQVATQLEEITVTAQKREENLQDVPIPLSVLNAAQLEKTFARDIQDLEGMSPNLIIDPILGQGTAAISIRGMQLNDVERSFDPAVAVYLDGIYLANTSGALLHVWDAEAVEVLRGPQGTLFGRNTIGGLVHVKRSKPRGELGGKLDLTYGSYEQFDAKGVLHLPAVLNDTLASKFSFVRLTGGGYFDNSVRHDNEGDTDVWGFTAAARWTPNDALHVALSYERIDDDTPTRPVTALTQTPQAFAFAGGGAKDDADYHRQTRTTSTQNSTVDLNAITTEISWRMSDVHTLIALGGWRATEERAEQEFDGVSADLFRTVRPQEDEQLSMELRWQADWHDDLKTVFGAYYWQSDYELHQSTTSFAFFGPPAIIPCPNGGDSCPPTGNPLGILTSDPDFWHETDAWAVFGQIDWRFWEGVTLSVGGRYIDEQKNACGAQNLNTLALDKFQVRAYGDCPQQLRTASFQDTALDKVTGEALPRSGTASWSDFTPRIGLSWQVDNDKLAYFTYSEGFRSGGFNGRSTDALTLGPYDPEKVKTFELGLKSTWLDNRLLFNINGFLTDYQNKQEDVVFSDPVQVTVTLVQNAATASINGIEAELIAIPTEGLTLGANLGWLDASYDDWTVFDAAGKNKVDKSGLALRRAPEFSFSLNGVYERQLAGGHFLIFTTNYAWRDDYHITANNVVVGPEKSYGLLDASINYETEHWRLSVWGKNILGEDYFLHALDVGSNFAATSATDPTPVLVTEPNSGLWTFGTINPPATMGVSVQYRF